MMSCDDKTSELDETGAAIAMEVAEQAMTYVGTGMTQNLVMSGVSHSGLSRAATAVNLNFDNSAFPTGINCSGTMVVEFDDATNIYDATITITVSYDDVTSEDGVWTMNGSLVSVLDISYDGSLQGDLSVSDGYSSYDFDFSIIQTMEMNMITGTSTITVTGTINADGTILTINKS
jgi:hypothetical protein